MTPPNRETQSGSTSRRGDGWNPAGSTEDERQRWEEDWNLGELLQELRILEQGSLVLTAFLIILPFNPGFSRLSASSHAVYLATFLCSLGSLVFLSAPAAHHRLTRPLRDRRLFKNVATRLTLVGLGLFSIALTLTTYLIVSAVFNDFAAVILAGVVAAFITIVWWVFPAVFPWGGERQG